MSLAYIHMHTKIYAQENPYWKSDCFSDVESYHHKTCFKYILLAHVRQAVSAMIWTVKGYHVP